MNASVRWAVLRAADAPAPSIVVDGATSDGIVERNDAEVLVREIRRQIQDAHPGVDGLGVKNIVLYAPRDGVLRVEFFQGVAFGELMPASQQICVNSLACAVVAATTWYPPADAEAPVVALMAGNTYVLRGARGPFAP